jgi:hypothetical protein
MEPVQSPSATPDAEVARAAAGQLVGVPVPGGTLASSIGRHTADMVALLDPAHDHGVRIPRGQGTTTEARA